MAEHCNKCNKEMDLTFQSEIFKIEHRCIKVQVESYMCYVCGQGITKYIDHTDNEEFDAFIKKRRVL